jgi:hypothetical protein
LQEVLGALVPAESGQGDPVERGVGLPVTAAVEPPALGVAGGSLYRADTAQGRVGAFAAEPPGVVAGRDEQRGGAVRSDTRSFQQLRSAT